MTEEEKCMDDADACETEEPIEKKIMRQKEAKLGESDLKPDPRDQCFDDGVNCDVVFDQSEDEEVPETKKNAEVVKEANLGTNNEQTLEEKCMDDADACEISFDEPE